jgi:signal peptidase I
LILEPTGVEQIVDEAALPLPLRARSFGRALHVAWEVLHDLSMAGVFCFFLITFVAQAFRVQGTSMEPLLQDEDRIIVNKLAYRLHAVEPGDVVVFWYPRDPSLSFIKRVIAGPGDTVEMRRGVVYVNGKRREEGFVPPSYRGRESHAAIRVAAGHFFVLGDHRRSSNDSRNWGEVPEKYIYGKAFVRFWPLSKLGLVD